MKIKGMVQVAGTTYRITRVKTQTYEVTRILDEVRAGSFFLGSPHEFLPEALAASELREVAREAIRNAKVSYSNMQRTQVYSASVGYDERRPLLVPQRSPA